jgi:translation elongation factor EF-1beta
VQSTVSIRGLGGTPEKKEIELNERIAEKEKEGWEVIDMQITPPAFGSQPVIILRLIRN